MKQTAKTKWPIIILIGMIVVGMVAAAFGVVVAVRVQFVRVRSTPDPTLKWQDFTPESGEFTAAFPGVPKTSSETFPQGPELVHAAVVEDRNGLFKVQWQHISPTESQVTPMLKSSLVQVLQKHRAVDVIPIETTDPAGAALECSGKGIVNGSPIRFRCRVAYANETVFIVLWTGSTGSTSSSDVDRFFQAFNCRSE